MRGYQTFMAWRAERLRHALTGLALGLVLAVILVVQSAQAEATFYLQDGNGFWWDFDADGSVIDGSDAPGDNVDAFDWAMRLRVNGVLFPPTTRQSLSGRILTTGPEMMEGLIVTRRAYVTDTPGEGWACFLDYLANPGNAPVNVTVHLTGNLGSDFETTITGSSSGDTVFAIDDRWVTSDDACDGCGDPSLSFNFWGEGAEITPAAVSIPASQADYFIEFPVTIPADATVILMYFCAQNENDAAAIANAIYLDTLPPGSLTALKTDSGHVINWSIPPDDLDVSPSGPFTATGNPGGPFTPPSKTLTLSNSGAAPVNWTAATDVPWLSLPAGGVVNPGNPVDITVSLNANANLLEAGEYRADVIITNTDSGVSFVRTVHVTVAEPLKLAPKDFFVLSSGVFVVRGRPGGPFTPLQAAYTLTNAGHEPIEWSVTPPAWLSVDISPPLSTPLAPGASAQIVVSLIAPIAEGMAPGDYAETIDINNDTLGSKVSAQAELRIRDAVFVKSEATPPHDGASWDTAFRHIQDGIEAAALTTPPGWVFVKGGTYLAMLTMHDDVEVFGGFLGTENHITERDLDNNPPTIVDANASGRPVIFNGVNNAGLDGFTVTGGLAHTGGGILFDAAGPGCYLASTIVLENTAQWRGGGIYCSNNSNPAFWNCQIIGNRIVPIPPATPDFGGGISCYRSSPNLLDCLIAANDGRFGGGVGCIESSPTLTNCIISGNSATIPTGGAGGGGIFAHNASSPILTNFIISGKSAHDWNAGTLYCQGNSHPVLTNCTISSNSSNDGRSGGILVNTGSTPRLINCIVENLSGIAIIEEEPIFNLPWNKANVLVSHSLFANNAVADFRNWTEQGAVNYTGGDLINANVNGAHDNVAGSPDPLYVAAITGQWTAPPVYDPGTNLTTLTASGTSFPISPGLRGRLINANMAQSRQALIMANTGETVSVLGDITAATGPYGYVQGDEQFMVLDYDLNGSSPCVNVGDDTAERLRDTDIEGRPRVGAADIGAYECQAPAGVIVRSITPQSGPVTNAETIVFEVVFSRALESGLGVEDFIINFLGLGKIQPTVLEVTGSDYRWFITVHTGDENGWLTLDLVDAGDPIADIIGLGLDAPFSDGNGVIIDFLEIVTHPVGAVKEPGDSHMFTVVAQNGIGALHYQWRHDGAPRGEDSPELEISTLNLYDTGEYVCEVSDDYTTVVSNPAILNVQARVPLANSLVLAIIVAACAVGGARTLAIRKKKLPIAARGNRQ